MPKLLALLATVFTCSLQSADALTVEGNFWSTDVLRDIEAVEATLETAPSARFRSSSINYPNGTDRRLHGNERRLSDFLGADAASLPPGTDFALDKGGVFRFAGEFLLREMAQIVTVSADNGFWLEIDGTRLLSGGANGGTTTASLPLDGLAPGWHHFELVYWQNRGQLGFTAALPYASADYSIPHAPLSPSLVLMATGFLLLAMQRCRISRFRLPLGRNSVASTR